MRRFASPKLKGAPEWYRYYAGYSTQFATDVIRQADLDPSALVLDPWNGAGTTTSAAHQLGYRSVGYDLNPALVVVARARLLSGDIRPSLAALGRDIVAHASQGTPLESADPLDHWLGPRSSAFVRAIEQAIWSVLASGPEVPNGHPRAVSHLSALASLYYVALFDVVRGLARQAVASNPTWVKSTVGRRAGTDQRRLAKQFIAAVMALSDRLPTLPNSVSAQDAEVHVASSTKLPIPELTVDAIVTSPPYCTRIDYVVATLPELAVLGVGDSSIRVLRQSMMGTPTIEATVEKSTTTWGSTATSFLSAVRNHSSKASDGYYRKYYSQYFEALVSSVQELSRVAKPGCRMGLVVQDSYYKNIHLDLPRITQEVLDLNGWRHLQSHEYVHRARSAINPRAAAHGAPSIRTEAVLIAARR